MKIKLHLTIGNAVRRKLKLHELSLYEFRCLELDGNKYYYCND